MAEIPLHADVAIVGGGPVGAALVHALAGSGIRVALLESRPVMAARDPRALALSQGTRLVLQRLGCWDRLEPRVTPIQTIHVSQSGRIGRALLAAEETGVPALGYTTEYGDLYGALAEGLPAGDASLILGARVTSVRPGLGCGLVEYSLEERPRSLTARFIILADGGKSLPSPDVKIKDYGQHAVICTVRTEAAHHGRAYERFTPSGPIALLPLGEAYALVWTTRNESLETRLAEPDATFLEHLQRAFGDRQGRFVEVGARSAFPLRLVTASGPEQPGLVRVGNAAQTLHPVAGQGFNLGLRDAWWLAQSLMDSPPDAWGGPQFLAGYRQHRRADVSGGIAMTDVLVELFANDIPGLAQARGIALSALDALPPLKSLFARKMMFGAQAW